MKIRNGFVSNSSSSSFTCLISNETAEYHDGWCGGYEGSMCICSAGHYFLSKYLNDSDPESLEDKKKDYSFLSYLCVENYFIATECDLDEKEIPDEEFSEASYKKLLKAISCRKIKKALDRNYNYIEQVPSFRCPVCNFSKVEYEDVIKFLLQEKFGSEATFADAEKYILEEFKNAKDLKKHIKGIKLL